MAAAQTGLPFLFGAFVKVHPATLILSWCMLVVVMQMLAPAKLFATSALVLAVAFSLSRHKFIQLLKRTRWIILSLLLIYAWSTPGERLIVIMSGFSPTLEGIEEGVTQLLRLLAVLATLAILLDRLHRQLLIAGLYTLFAPLHWLGLSRERLAVRLALTLHYAEASLMRKSAGWQDTLSSMFETHPESQKQMELTLYRFGAGDAVLLCLALLVTGVVLL